MTVFKIVVSRFVSLTQVERYGLGALAGLLMHHGCFKHGQWHLYTPSVLLSHALVSTCLFTLSIYCAESTHHPLYRAFTPIISGYLAALFISIAVYRLMFHHLAGFPGPLTAHVTKLWHVWACRGSRYHLVLDTLHQKYGDFVRTGENQRCYADRNQLMTVSGPSEITVFHPDVFMVIDGPKTKCIKSEWYDILHPNLSLVTSRVKESHQICRRQWNRGFSTKGWLTAV